jgi:hypothetical protein
MSSEHLASAKNHLKGDLGGSWNILDGASAQYTDLGIARRFGGAAAAYSLRDVGAMNGRVVKVRREQDTTPVDFSAGAIASGGIEQFAIGQSVLDKYNNAAYFPAGNADYFTISSIDLTGAFTITTSFIFTGDETQNELTLFFGNAGKDVINFTNYGQFRFRRDTDNKYINLDTDIKKNTLHTLVVTRDSSDVVSISIDGVTQSNTVTEAGIYKINRLGFRNRGTIFDININGVAAYTGDGADVSNWTDTIGSNDATKVGSPVAFTGQGISAFVDTWYDQSSNGNDAVQATTSQQPKIIENGSFVTSESGEKTIKFIGSSLSSGSYGGGNFLAANSLASTFSGDNKTISSFLVSSSVENNTNGVMFGFGRSSDDTPKLLGLYHSGGKIGVQFRADDNTSQTHQTTIAYSANTDLLYTIIRPSTTADLIKDGTVGQDDVNVDVGDTTLDRFSIGVLTRTGNALFLNGTISELIIYSTDQGSDRTEIETDINNYYNIYS